MLKLAENIVKGDIIYLPDEDAWLKVADISKQVTNQTNTIYLVWVDGDDIAIHYYPTQAVEYKTV